MDQQEKDRIAQEKYGKPFAELTTNEQKAVGGVHGGHTSLTPEERGGGGGEGMTHKPVAMEGQGEEGGAEETPRE